MPAAGYQDFLKDLLMKASLQGGVSLCELALYVVWRVLQIANVLVVSWQSLSRCSCYVSDRHHASHAQLQRVPFSSPGLNLVAQLLPRGFMSPTTLRTGGTGDLNFTPALDNSPRAVHVHKLVKSFEQHGTLHAIATHASLHALRQQQLLLVPNHSSESDAWSTDVSISQGNEFVFAASQSISYHHSLLTPTFGHTHPPVTVQDSTVGRGVAAAAASTATRASLSFCMYVSGTQTSFALLNR